jgi:Carboxypeptidase regulatory-like domain
VNYDSPWLHIISKSCQSYCVECRGRGECGGTIAKAPITLHHEVETNLVYTTATNENGFYTLPNVPPGRDELKISFAGFSNYTQTGIVLTVGQNAALDVVLKVASKGEQVVLTRGPYHGPCRRDNRMRVVEAGGVGIFAVLKTRKLLICETLKTQKTAKSRPTGTYLERGIFSPLANFVRKISLLRGLCHPCK